MELPFISKACWIYPSRLFKLATLFHFKMPGSVYTSVSWVDQRWGGIGIGSGIRVGGGLGIHGGVGMGLIFAHSFVIFPV